LTALPSTPPLFPYTTLFRSWAAAGEAAWRDASAASPGQDLRTAADVHQRLTELGSPAVQPGAPSCLLVAPATGRRHRLAVPAEEDRKSTRLNSSHDQISYAV